MNLCLIITIDRARSTLLVTVNTFRACVYFVATVGKLSYLVIVLMGHTMVVNIQFYFVSLDLIPRWLTRDIHSSLLHKRAMPYISLILSDLTFNFVIV